MTLKGDKNKKLVDFFEEKSERDKKSQEIFDVEKSKKPEINYKKINFKKRKIKKRYFKKFLILILNKRVAAGLTIFFLCFAFLFEGIDKTQGATYIFSQTNWNGGADGGTYPSHPGDTSSWTKYDSKDSGVVLLNSGADLGLASSSSSITHDTDTDFSSGTASSSETSGTGSAAVIQLTTQEKVADIQVDGYERHNCALGEDGSVYCWGANNYGQLGNNSTTESYVPVKVLAGASDAADNDGTYLSNIKKIGVGYYTSCALSNSGYVYCWGNNSSGQLGNNSNTASSVPVRVLAGASDAADNDGTYLNNIANITAGNASVCALSALGYAYCWGLNAVGQLGDNSVTARKTPVRVLAGASDAADNDGTYLNNISEIDVGYGGYAGFTCAVSVSGYAYCWGKNTYGSLGDGTTNESHVPVRVLAGASDAADNDGTYLDNLSSVSAGTGSACSLANSGYVYCWGSNTYGQLGDNSTTQSETPVRVVAGSSLESDNDGTYLNNMNKIYSSGTGVAVINPNGYAYAWGSNSYNALGLSTGSYGYPRMVLAGTVDSNDTDGTYLKNITSASSGLTEKCYATSSGYVYCSGKNYYGELGDGTTSSVSEPSFVHGVSDSGYLYLKTNYISPGTFTNIIDTSGPSNFSTLDFTATTPTGTTLTVDVRAGNTASPDETWSDWITGVSNGGDISSLANYRYLQYRVNLAASDLTATPSFDSITVNYYNYSTSGYLISSAYDSSDSANVLSGISWTENAATGSEIKFQLRTAPDNSGAPGTWTDWMGTDGTSSSYFTDSTGGDLIPSALSDNTNDQWIQYKVLLTSNGAVLPILSDVAVTYVVNAVPQIQNVTASQVSDGTVYISYEVKDSDTTSGSFTPGYITPSFEYWNGSAWVACTTMSSGDTDNKAVVEGSFTSYSATWIAKTDFDEEFMNGTAKIRVTINDNEGANNTASAESSTFTLDTSDPTGLSLVIDHTQNTLTLATPSDDSNYQMAVSNLANFSGATYVDFSTVYSYSSMTSDPATVYVRIKDIYGNYTDISATTPDKPENLTYYDVTDTANEEYREMIAWSSISSSASGSGFSAYKVYRSTDGETYSLLTSISDRLLNFYVDNGVELGETYYYKIYVEDSSGNKSQFSEIISDTIDGQGSSDSTPPTISNVQVSGIQTTSATVNWDTDEVSNSSVGYSTDATYLPEIGSSYMGTEHEITLTGLTPGTEYNIRVQSQDASGNTGQNDKDSPGSTPIGNFTFETLPGPAISSVTIPQVANSQATIEWTTTTDSATYVVYSSSVSGGSLVDPVEIGTPDLVGGDSPYKHSQTITELSENTRYYFYVKSVDASDNVAIDNNGGEFYELLTTQDDDAPELSSIETSIVSDTEAAIHWVTDEQATSKVKYATSSGGPYTDTTEVTVLSRSHYVILTGLSSDTDYFYKVISSDINENESMSAEYEFTTLKNPEYQHDALSEISDITESIITDEKAVVKFDTDEGAQCSVEFGTESDNYTEVPVSETDYDKDHSIHLTGLIFSTTYYYKITCADNLDNVVSSDEESFTTLALQEDADEDDAAAPEISGVDVGTITGESVTVTWDTNEAANSLVKYGITEDYENIAGNVLVNSDTNEYVTSHEVIINNLIPDTKYFYAVISIDAAGNIGESSQGDFSTKAASSLSSINIESNSLNEVTITWKSSEKTTSMVEYGLTEEYGDKKESSTSTKEHSVSLSGLKSNEVYHFRVKGKDESDNWYSSGDYTLEPKSPPNISDIKIGEITEHGAIITFSTNVPTDALITYTSTDGESSGSQGKPDLSVKHEIELVGLNSGTNFGFTIKATDEDGNSTESEERSFQTGKDENAPVIEQIKTDSGLALNDKVQTIITWGTDEATNAKLIYKEGKNGEEKEMEVDESFSLYHIAVLTEFKSGTVYYFKVKSADIAGNETISEEYALLTPKKKENIVQVIISNFEDIFGWAKVGR